MYIILGGIQTLLVMNAVKCGSSFLSLMNIQLFFVITAHLVTCYLNYKWIKDTTLDEIDLISFLIILLGVYMTNMADIN